MIIWQPNLKQEGTKAERAEGETQRGSGNKIYGVFEKIEKENSGFMHAAMRCRKNNKKR